MKKVKTTQGKLTCFKLSAKPGNRIFVAGSFNQWNPTEHQLRDSQKRGVFQIKLALPPGCHEYKFVVDGQWRVDPACAEWAPNIMGTLNSVVAV